MAEFICAYDWFIKDLMFPFFTAALGAWSAFKLQAWREDRKERLDQITELRKAQFILSKHYNSSIFLSGAYSKFKDDPNRAFHMPMLKRGGGPMTIDLNTLQFMGSDFGDGLSKKQKKLLIEPYKIFAAIIFSQETYLQLENAIKDRNTLFMKLIDEYGKDFKAELKNNILLSIFDELTSSIISLSEKTISMSEIAFTLTNEYLRVKYSCKLLPKITEVQNG